jgi:hypothetical protein
MSPREQAVILKLLNVIHAPKIARLKARRQHRQGLPARIAELARNDKIWVIESGMDCDCNKYSGFVHEIPATLAALDKLTARLEDWADGSYTLELAAPDSEVEYSSRDLAAEAFENGNPHYIGA